MGLDIAFWILAVVGVLAALGVVLLRSIFRAALSLVLCFLAVAGIYVTLSADFLAAVQILVYVGAISVLIILAIMLTKEVQRGSLTNRLRVPAFIVAVLFFGVVAFAIFQTSWQLAGVPPIQATSSYAPGDLLTAFNCGEQPLGRVALFTGCVMDHWYRSVHDATIRVLRWNGYEVQIFAKQTCCGALHTHIGLADVGSAMARDSLAAVGSDIAAVVVNSAGCGHQLKEHRAAAATYDLYDIAEWLAPRLNQPPKQQLAQVVTYDPPCHLLHAQSISAEPLILLEASCQKLVTVETAEMCCGSGGLYSLYQGQLSAAVTRAKMAKLINSGAEIVATGNPGCHMQLQSGLKMAGSAIAVKHTMEVLDSAYSLDQNYRAVFEFGA